AGRPPDHNGACRPARYDGIQSRAFRAPSRSHETIPRRTWHSGSEFGDEGPRGRASPDYRPGKGRGRTVSRLEPGAERQNLEEPTSSNLSPESTRRYQLEQCRTAVGCPVPV